MKVLNIIQRYPPAIGGSENWCSNICQFLVKKGIISKVATINLNNIENFFKEPSLEQEYIKFGNYDYENGIFVRRYKLWSFYANGLSQKIINFLLYKIRLDKTEIGGIFKQSPHSFEMYLRLFKEIKEADVVHLHALPYFHNLVGFFIAKAYKKKIAITPYFHPGHPYYERKIFYEIMKESDAIIALTKYEKDYLVKKGLDHKKIFVTGCFIDTKYNEITGQLSSLRDNLFKKYAITEKFKKIIFIGRKEIHKGVGILIEAAKEIASEENTDICLFLVGPDLPEFNVKYPHLGNTERLKIINFGILSEEEKADLIRVSDLLALPSQFESFGIVFLEAWRHKKPVIGSDRGAIPEVIKDAGLCAEYNNLSDLKEKIKVILFDSELARKLGEAGKKRLEKEYSTEAIGNKVFHIYNILRKARKRLLVISHLFPPYVMGGSEIVAYEQSRVIKKMGFEIKIFAGKLDNKIKHYKISREKKEFEITRVNLNSVDFDYQSPNFNKEEIQGEFHKDLYQFAPDVVHFHNIYPLSLRMIDECYKMNIPIVMTLHDYWGICFKNTLITDNGLLCDKKDNKCLYCRENFIKVDGNPSSLSERNRLFIEYLNKVNLLISPSKYLIKRFIDCGVYPDKTVVINNGIDILRFKKIKKTKTNKARFGYIGQILEHKGIENILRGFSLLNSKEKNRISLILVGTGDKTFIDYCKGLIYELEIANFVKFIGKVENNKINNIFKNIDVLVVPSIWPENSPVTIMEALATGTPVLASDIGGIPELIQDGSNGYLHRYDDPESLAINIKRFIERPETIKTMGKACLLEAKEHDLVNQVKIIAQHYNRLIERN